MSKVEDSNGFGTSGEQYSAPSDKRIQANQHNAMKSTGPRTLAGKAKSSQNARKHGLTGVLPITTGEGKEDLEAFEEMRIGLYESWKPEGWQEEQLVETLAGDYLRLQRASRYEAGVTRKFSDYATNGWQLLRTNHFQTQVLVANQGLWDVFLGETYQGIDYQCEFLRNISKRIKVGVDLTSHQLLTIRGLFGEPDRPFSRNCGNLWALIQKCRKEQKPEEAAKYQDLLMAEVAQQIQWLQEKRKGVAARESAELEAELLMVSLPPWEVLERLARYTTTIFRRFDRTMNQLERLLRMRRGEFVPPPVAVQVSVEAPLSQGAGVVAVPGSELPAAAPEPALRVIPANEDNS